jgi:pyruvate formate lyase activating enzyme
LIHLAGTPQRGLLHRYRDPLPTNCVADWICEGSQHPGFHNLAVFYASCTANCLFCQNWHFREILPTRGKTISAFELASAASPRTFCVCFFAGDPASQMPHALAAAKLLAQRGVRVCWETNGMMHPKLLDVALQYSLQTGGCVKFDLKTFDEELSMTLNGVSNRRTLENFARAARRFDEQPELPLVMASTLWFRGTLNQTRSEKLRILSLPLTCIFLILCWPLRPIFTSMIYPVLLRSLHGKQKRLPAQPDWSICGLATGICWG